MGTKTKIPKEKCQEVDEMEINKKSGRSNICKEESIRNGSRIRYKAIFMMVVIIFSILLFASVGFGFTVKTDEGEQVEIEGKRGHFVEEGRRAGTYYKGENGDIYYSSHWRGTLRRDDDYGNPSGEEEWSDIEEEDRENFGGNVVDEEITVHQTQGGDAIVEGEFGDFYSVDEADEDYIPSSEDEISDNQVAEFDDGDKKIITSSSNVADELQNSDADISTSGDLTDARFLSKDEAKSMSEDSDKVVVQGGRAVSYKDRDDRGMTKDKEITTESFETQYMDGGDTHNVEITTEYNDDGGIKSETKTVEDEDGNVIAKQEDGGEIEKGENNDISESQFANAQDSINQQNKRETSRRIKGAMQRGAKWSKLSSIFGMEDDFSDWRQSVDEIFHNALLGGVDYWTESLCMQQSELEGEKKSSIFSKNANGRLYQSATITATKQKSQTPNGTKWLYRVTFFVRNPDTGGGGGMFGGDDDSGGGSSDGTIARGSSTSRGSSKGEMTDKEEEVWNVVEKSGEEIKNAKTSTSQTSSGEKITFNLEFRGDQTIQLFREDQTVDTGDEITYAGEDSIGTYSKNNYNEVCVMFYGEKPVDAFYEEKSEICTNIEDITEKEPTQIPVEEETETEDKGGDGKFRTI